jgi:hypothetical protein
MSCLGSCSQWVSVGHVGVLLRGLASSRSSTRAVSPRAPRERLPPKFGRASFRQILLQNRPRRLGLNPHDPQRGHQMRRRPLPDGKNRGGEISRPYPSELRLRATAWEPIWLRMLLASAKAGQFRHSEYEPTDGTRAAARNWLKRGEPLRRELYEVFSRGSSGRAAPVLITATEITQVVRSLVEAASMATSSSRPLHASGFPADDCRPFRRAATCALHDANRAAVPPANAA